MITLRSPSRGPDPDRKTQIFGHFGHLSPLGHVITGWIALYSIEMVKINCVLIDSVKKNSPGGAAGGHDRPNGVFWRFGRSELWNLDGL